MCGRYTIYTDLTQLAERFGFDAGDIDLSPSYNLAPTQSVLTVVRSEGNRAELMRWGLIPSWAKDMSIGSRMIDARAETVALREAGKSTGEIEFPGATLYTTFEPCPMCCGAIMTAGVSTLVMGGRPAPGEGRWGDYTVEGLIETAAHGANIEVVTGILTRECVDIR